MPQQFDIAPVMRGANIPMGSTEAMDKTRGSEERGRQKEADSLMLIIIALIGAPLIFTAVWAGSGFGPFVYDANWYLSVAKEGYHFDGNIFRQQNVAFLPGYPLLIWLVHSITGVSLNLSQYFASLLCFIAGSVCFFNALCKWFRVKESAVAMLIFSLNPFAIYFFNGYSEALFYLLCSIFFLAIVKERIWISSIALSFALITRPHAVALYPVLIYVIARKQGLISSGSFIVDRARIKDFFRSAVDHIAISIIFPAILTIYWYVSFSDPLVYLNALTAWSGVAASGIRGQLVFLWRNTFDIHQLAVGKVAEIPVVAFAPSNIAALNFVINSIAIVFLFRQKKVELALFSLSLLVFWSLKSSPGDSGRHGLMMIAFPIMFASAFFNLPAKQGVKFVGRIPLNFTLKQGFLILFLIFNLFHFLAYASIQLKGGWIS